MSEPYPAAESRAPHGDEFDVVIVGAGLGGSALAWSLRASGLRILILERGGYIPQEEENWDPDAVIAAGRYEPGETWLDQDGKSFRPRVYYNVGGSSKFFGGSAFRLRREDFGVKSWPEGSTPPWPIDYDELAPWYDIAEQQMRVHGRRGADPSEPTVAGAAGERPPGDYPFPPLEDEPDIAWLRERLLALGLHPFPLPIAVHQGAGGHCRKGSPCDGFPCKIRAKGDGENAFLRPALRELRTHPVSTKITLLTDARVERLEHDDSGRRVTRVVYRHEGASRQAQLAPGGTVALAAGAANSALLLLRSRSSAHPDGLGNGSGLVGRNFMAHNNTVLMAIHPLRRNRTRFQKTMAINDWYLPGGNLSRRFALGNIQMRGKVQPQNLAHSPRPLVRLLRQWIAARSFDFWLMSEDLPAAENRIEQLESGEIRLTRRLNNSAVHRELVRRFRAVLRRCGFRLILEREPEPRTIQHQVGTIRFGNDPQAAVLDRWCRSFEVENLYVVDGSVFPSSAAVNPALTIAANALRVGSHIVEAGDGTNRHHGQ